MARFELKLANGRSETFNSGNDLYEWYNKEKNIKPSKKKKVKDQTLRKKVKK